MRLWKPHDPGRSCLHFTIRHHVANETDLQNDGALRLAQMAGIVGSMVTFVITGIITRLVLVRLGL
jgi:hypothetical protein